MTTSKSRRAALASAAVILIFVGSIALFYSASPYGLLFFGAGALCIVWAFRRFAGATAVMLASGVCAVATWATLGGGAESWTAIPWIVAGALSAFAAIYLVRRRLRLDAAS